MGAPIPFDRSVTCSEMHKKRQKFAWTSDGSQLQSSVQSSNGWTIKRKRVEHMFKRDSDEYWLYNPECTRYWRCQASACYSLVFEGAGTYTQWWWKRLTDWSGLTSPPSPESTLEPAIADPATCVKQRRLLT